MSLMPKNSPYGQPNVELQDISQQRKYADQLRQQGAQNLPGEMISGHYVAPSWTQQLARVLQSGLAGYYEQDSKDKENAYATTKSKKLADFLAGNKPQQIAGTPVETSTIPAYTPEQQDRFGSPLPNVQREPVVTTTTPMTQESMSQVQDRQRQAGYALASEYQNDPAISLALNDLNHQRDRGELLGDKADDRVYADTKEEKIYNRGRTDKLSDTDAERKYQDIVRADTQGFQVTQQDKQFVQQFKLQGQSQGFQASQSANNQRFQSSENQKQRDATLSNEKLKLDASAAAKNGTPIQKILDAKDVLGILQQAAPLINKSTNSGIGNMVDQGLGFFGNSTSGAQSSASLKALEGSLVSKMPKMSGPQSDKDVLLYKQMAGQIGDPTLPAAQKKAAMNTILQLNSQYAGVPYKPLNFGDNANADMPDATHNFSDAEYLGWKKANGK